MKQSDYLKVPIPMCIYVAQNNLEKPFQTFLHLKMQYQTGKARLSKIEMLGMCQVMGVKNIKTLKTHLNKLYSLGWIKYNKKSDYYLINSFERIRRHYDWESRASIAFNYSEIKNIFALVGGAIYTYQFYDFWRKVKREKIVRLMGRTYNFLSPSFNFREHHAPVATTGIEALYGISQSKASRIKRAAFRSSIILVKKDFKKLNFSRSDIKLMMKYGNLPKSVKQKKGSFYLQLIDLVLPTKRIKRRPKLTT